jgi:hypothetical protein
MSRWTDAVSKLIELTKAGGLEWVKPSETMRFTRFSRDVNGIPYFTTFQDKHLVVYEARYSSWDEDSETSYSTYGAVLEFVEMDGQLEFAWPVPSELVQDLLQQVRYRTSGASSFLDKLLKTEVAPKATGKD